MPHLDLVADILERVSQHAKLSAKAALAIEREVREDWGGERHYVAKLGESGRMQLAERDKRIRDEYRHGERIKFLAHRHGISVKRVQQIVGDTQADGNGLP